MFANCHQFAELKAKQQGTTSELPIVPPHIESDRLWFHSNVLTGLLLSMVEILKNRGPIYHYSPVERQPNPFRLTFCSQVELQCAFYVNSPSFLCSPVPSAAISSFSVYSPVLLAAMEEGELLEEGELSDAEATAVAVPPDSHHLGPPNDLPTSPEPPFKRRRRFKDELGGSPSLSADISSPTHSVGLNGVEVPQTAASKDDVSKASPTGQQEVQRRRGVHSELAALYKAYSTMKQGAARMNGQRGGKSAEEAEEALGAVVAATKGASLC